MGEEEYICYKKLKVKYGDKYNFKSLILPKLGLNENYEIKTLEDISELQIKFAKKFPYNGNDVLNQNYSIDLDYIVDTIIVLEKGGFCLTQNILFAMLLTEFNINVQMINCFDLQNPYPSFSKHFTNIIEFNEKWYLVEGCFLMLSSFYPMEIGNDNNEHQFNDKSPSHRVISKSGDKKEHNGTYLLQRKEQGLNDNDNWNSVLSFTIDRITFDYIKKSIKEGKDFFTNYCYKKNLIKLYLKFDNGYYFYNEGIFTINYDDNKPKKSIQINNITQLSKIIIKYFKILNFDLSSLK